MSPGAVQSGLGLAFPDAYRDIAWAGGRMTYSEKRLTRAEWAQLTRAVERADFWNSEHTLCLLEQIDGDCRVLEGRSGHEYNMPGHLPDVEDVLIRLSGLDHPQKGWAGSNRSPR